MSAEIKDSPQRGDRAHHPRNTELILATTGDENASLRFPPSSDGKERAMRRVFKQAKPLQERLLEEAQNLRDEAKLLPYGPLRDAALKKARQVEAAAHMDDWLSSPGLQPPKKDDTPGPH
jgi:hypothetical protein